MSKVVEPRRDAGIWAAVAELESLNLFLEALLEKANTANEARLGT